MGMTRLAFLNFKSGFKNYLSLVLSLAFTVLVFLNFQNMLGSDAYKVLGTRNKEYIDILVGTASFVLGCFMVFFYLVFHQCVSGQEKKGDRSLCVHGPFQSEDRKAVSD